MIGAFEALAQYENKQCGGTTTYYSQGQGQATPDSSLRCQSANNEPDLPVGGPPRLASVRLRANHLQLDVRIEVVAVE